ncbi:TPA: hypothetical protein KUM59_000803 [Citrobacter freundii]|nr:hypothetical protein [Citrobacter freundii]HBH6852913.1 hypothetical protein [Citrobacter freundii]
MKVSFANRMATALSKCFFYCPANDFPSIQIGKPNEGDVIFWLKYDDVAINKCAGLLIRELGNELGMSDVQSAKKLLLRFCSEAYNCIDADFYLLHLNGGCVDDIITKIHRRNIRDMFKEYVCSRIRTCSYVYSLGVTCFTGKLMLSDSLCLYGSDESVSLLADIKNKTGMDIPRFFFEKDGMQYEPLGKYFSQSNSSVVVAYASSEDEAVEIFNRFFGALCLAVDNPFMINRVGVNNLMESFEDGKYHVGEFRVNMPSVYDLNMTDLVQERLVKIFTSPDKRMLSALSFIAHGWKHDRRERFLNQFIALDAMYGSNVGNKNSIIGGVCRDAARVIDIDSKIEIIYELRCKFVHGDIPTLSEHGSYLKFIDCHGVDPMVSLFEIIKECVFNYNGIYKTPKDDGEDAKSIYVPAELLPTVKRMIAAYSKSR